MGDGILAEFPWYGSSRKGEYRVVGAADPNGTQDSIYRACRDQADRAAVRVTHEGLKYLDAGWEWSVFDDREYVVKIPSGIFPETADSRYLANSKKNHDTIANHLGKEFVARTEFHDSSPVIRQERLRPLPGRIPFADCPLEHWRPFFSGMIELLESEDWLPDLNMNVGSNWFRIGNVMADDRGCPRVIDFTAYFDVFRLYPERTRHEVRSRRQQLNLALVRLSECHE